MKISDYAKAQGWLKRHASSENSVGEWEKYVALNTTPELDIAIKTINDKFGPGTVFPASEAPIPPMTDQQAIFEWEERNRKAGGGRIGFEKGLLVSDLTPNELTAAQVSARRAGISGKKDSKEFADFVGGDTYKRRITMDKEWAEEAGFDLETWKKMNKKERARAFFNKKYRTEKRTKAGNVVGDTVEEIVIQLQKGGTLTKQQKEKKMLYDTYADIFKEEFNKLKNLGEPFSRRDLTEQVIARIEEKYTTPDKYFNEDFLPTRDLTGDASKSWYDFISPSKKSDAKKALFPNTETANKFFSQESTYLRRTATQEKVFDLLAKGVNEIDDIAAELEIPRNRVKLAVTRMLRNMYDSKKVPAFLQNRQDNFGDVADALENSKSLEGYKKRNIRKTIYETFPEDSPKIKTALKKINEFDSYIDNLKKDFPGLKINYDHPASYQALKNQNLKGFLNITPIQQDLNNFKSQFDLRSQLNLGAMEDALGAGNMEEYKKLLQKQRGIERLWSNLTGGQSTLGRVRLGKATNLGTKELLDGSKNLIKEFEGNLSIRENIARNIDPSVKFYDPVSKTNKTLLETMDSLFPVAKGQTKLIERAKKLTSPELLDMNKKIINQLTGGDPKLNKFVSQNFMSSGPAGAYEMLSNDLKKIINSEGFKTWKAKIANPTLTAAGKAARLPAKFFGVADLALGYLDYSNNRQKGWSKEDSKAHMIETLLFGFGNMGEKADMAGVKKVAMEKYNMSSEVFDQLIEANKNQNEVKQIITDFAAQNKDAKERIDAGLADEVGESLILLRNKDKGQKRLQVLMKEAIEREPSLKTNLQVQEAGAPIDINVDKGKALGDLSKSSYDFVQKRIEDSDLEKIANYRDTTRGGIGDKVSSVFQWDIFNLLRGQPTEAMKHPYEMEKLKREDPQLYYKMLLSEGVDPHRNMNIPVHLEWEQKYPYYGTPISDEIKKSTSYFDGGIASLRRKK